MAKLAGMVVASLCCVALLSGASHFAFMVASPRSAGAAGVSHQGEARHHLGAATHTEATASFSATSVAGACLAVGLVGAACMKAIAGRSSSSQAGRVVVPLAGAVPQATLREALVACQALGDVEEGPSVSEMDEAIEGMEKFAKQVTAGVAAAVVFVGSMPAPAEAFPIFAQQNYAEPREPSGKIACANCHLRGRAIEVRMPAQVLPDTIFKIQMEVPANYKEKKQLAPDGSRVDMNVGGIIIMPEGFKLAPRDRLPKELKKEMKGLAWSVWSKEKPNVLVAGPVANKYETMIAPVLAPSPGKTEGVESYSKYAFFFGGNRGRGQVYPEGNNSNINPTLSPVAGKITSIEGDSAKKVTIAANDGSTSVLDVLPGARFLKAVGDPVRKDEYITSDPNVGGFGQEEKEVQLQDLNRLYAYLAIATSIFVAQVSFVLKKKQFEKVQLAEGF